MCLLIDGEFRGGFDVLQTFTFDLSAIAEVNILRVLLDDGGCTLLDTCGRLGAWNAVERFDDGEDNIDDDVGGDVSINDGVDTQSCDAASGVTTSVTSGNPAAAVPCGKRSL